MLGTNQTRLFMIISISLVHSFSFSSLRCTTNFAYYESFENCAWFSQSLLEKHPTAFFMMFSIFMSLSKTSFFNSSRKQRKSSVSWWFCCLFHILKVSAMYDTDCLLSITCYWNFVLSKLAGKTPCQVFYDDFHVCSTFSCYWLFTMHNEFCPLWVLRKLDLFYSWRKHCKSLLSWWL